MTQRFSVLLIAASVWRSRSNVASLAHRLHGFCNPLPVPVESPELLDNGSLNLSGVRRDVSAAVRYLIATTA
jgi:hypothetical protein